MKLMRIDVSMHRMKVGEALRDPRNTFLPTFFPRLLAAFCVVVLIGALALSCILGIAFIGPAISHGQDADHAVGTIILIGPGKNFVLLTTMGQQLSFQCGTNCRASPGHMQRHLAEHARTDVYYTEGSNDVLVALDVD
jgi:hypothetical protein